MSGLGSASASMSTVVASFSPSESRESASCSPSTQQGLWKYGGLVTLLTSQSHLQMHDGTFRLRPHKSPSSGVPPILQQKGPSQRARRREAPGAVSGPRLFPSSVAQEVWASVRARPPAPCGAGGTVRGRRRQEPALPPRLSHSQWKFPQSPA